MGWSAFRESALESVSLPSTLKRVESNAFNECVHLRTVALSEGIESIGLVCFWGAAIEEITIPASVMRIETQAFENCTKLRRMTFADGSRLEKISRYALCETGLTQERVRFPNCAKVSVKAFES